MRAILIIKQRKINKFFVSIGNRLFINLQFLCHSFFLTSQLHTATASKKTLCEFVRLLGHTVFTQCEVKRFPPSTKILMIMIKCRAHFAGGDTRLDLPPSPIVTSDLRLCLNAVFIGDNLCIYGSSFGSDVFFGNNMLPRTAGSVLCERTAFWDNEGFRRRKFLFKWHVEHVYAL